MAKSIDIWGKNRSFNNERKQNVKKRYCLNINDWLINYQDPKNQSISIINKKTKEKIYHYYKIMIYHMILSLIFQYIQF